MQRSGKLKSLCSLLLQCYESSGLFLAEAVQVGLEPIVRPPTPGPPPAYDTVVAEKEKIAEAEKDTVSEESSKITIPSDETGLPSYEAALRIEAGGYV